MKTRWYFFLFMLATAARAAEAGIEFSAVLADGNETRVSLIDTASKQSRWVKIGQEFNGYTVAAYESAGSVVVLKKGGQQFRIGLKGAKVREGAVVEPPPEVQRAILNNLRQLAAAADQYYLENGKTRVTLDELVGETKYVRRLIPVAGEDYTRIEFAQGKKMTVTTAGGFPMSYAP